MLTVPSSRVHQELVRLIPNSFVADPNSGQCIISPYRDSHVVCPSANWMADAFWTKVLQPSLQKYETEQFDCDDFSIRCMDRLSACLTATKELVNAGYAASACYLRINGELLHCNIIYRDDRGEWWFYEPQNGQQTPAKPAIDTGVATPYFVFL